MAESTAVAEPAVSIETVVADTTEEIADVVTEDVLVEEVSIDGMCGVY
jgi:mycofactocin precursor